MKAFTVSQVKKIIKDTKKLSRTPGYGKLKTWLDFYGEEYLKYLVRLFNLKSAERVFDFIFNASDEDHTYEYNQETQCYYY